MSLKIVPMDLDQCSALAEMLNHTIRLGGTTAYETEFTEDTFAAEFLTGNAVHSSRVAMLGTRAVGFQTLFLLDDGSRALSIATFADQRNPVGGVGRALFAETEAASREYGAPYIRAVIRADNKSGLRYYRGRGFVDYGVRPAVPLADGTPVDRIETRFIL